MKLGGECDEDKAEDNWATRHGESDAPAVEMLVGEEWRTKPFHQREHRVITENISQSPRSLVLTLGGVGFAKRLTTND
jgi:hypothetical protein